MDLKRVKLSPKSIFKPQKSWGWVPILNGNPT